MKNVLEWLEEAVKNNPEKIVYKENNFQASFKYVYECAKSIGSYLLDNSIQGPVAVIGARKITTIIAYFGVVYSGNVYAPIDGSLPENRIDLMLKTLDSNVILIDESFVNLKDSLIEKGFSVHNIGEILQYRQNSQLLKNIRDKMVITDPLYIIFTSGSTGNPKGVLTSHESLIFYIKAYSKVMGINKNDIIGCQSPLDYIAAIRDIYVPLYNDCSMVIIPKEYFIQPKVLFSYIEKNKITSISWAVPAFTMIYNLGGLEEIRQNFLDKVCFSGAVMPIVCLKKWMDILPNAKFVNQYGPTETTASCTYYKIEKNDLSRKSLPIGYPYDNYKIIIVDENQKELPNGCIGEICVGGPILALGYYNNLQMTKKSFIINPNNKYYEERIYRTGDYGKISEDGVLEFHGRTDRQIKYMGHRVELDEIEYVLHNMESIEECACIYENEKINLFYVGILDSKSVNLEMRKYLPRFMIPRVIKKMDKIPKLPNGKIDICKLKELIK